MVKKKTTSKLPEQKEDEGTRSPAKLFIVGAGKSRKVIAEARTTKGVLVESVELQVKASGRVAAKKHKK